MADTKKEWFSVTEKNTVNINDNIIVYAGSNSRPKQAASTTCAKNSKK